MTQDWMFTDTGEARFIEPDHYNRNGISVDSDILKQVFTFFGGDIDPHEAFYIGNIVKYLMRYPYKGDSEGDLDKLIHYAELLKKIETN